MEHKSLGPVFPMLLFNSSDVVDLEIVSQISLALLLFFTFLFLLLFPSHLLLQSLLFGYFCVDGDQKV